MNLVLGNPDVALRGPWDKTNIIKVAPTADDLAQGLFDYHLDFPGNAVAPGCTYDDWSHRITAGSAPRTYARALGRPEAADRRWYASRRLPGARLARELLRVRSLPAPKRRGGRRL